MENIKNYLIIYHKEDNDGHFSAAIFYNYLVEQLSVKKHNIYCLGVNYEDLNNICKVKSDGTMMLDTLIQEYDTIIMTDMSFNDPKMMVKLYEEKKNKFIWIDHHAPIIKESFKLKFDNAAGLRRTDRSAILNAY